MLKYIFLFLTLTFLKYRGVLRTLSNIYGENFVKIVNDFQPLIIFAKRSILGVSDICFARDICIARVPIALSSCPIAAHMYR